MNKEIGIHGKFADLIKQVELELQPCVQRDNIVGMLTQSKEWVSAMEQERWIKH